MAVELQKLIYAGKVLADSTLMKDVGIKEGLIMGLERVCLACRGALIQAKESLWNQQCQRKVRSILTAMVSKTLKMTCPTIPLRRGTQMLMASVTTLTPFPRIPMNRWILMVMA